MQKQSYSFESQILQQFSLLLIVFSGVVSVSNILLGLEQGIILITFVLTLLSSVIWWIQRRYHRFKISRILLSSIILVSINLAWYYNYDSQGPILSLFIMFSILIIFIWPLKTAAVLATGIFINVLGLFSINYWYSADMLIYPSDSVRIIDSYLGALIAVIIVSIFSILSKRNYIKKYHQALKSEELKSAFLQNVSQDVRTPFNLIMGFSELLKDNDLTEADRNKFAQTIQNGGESLLSMINNTVEISMLNTHQIEVNTTTFDLFELLDSIKHSIELNPNLQNNLSMIYPDPSEYSFRWIKSDKAKIKSVIIHLISNAIKNTKEGVIGIFITKTAANLLEFSVHDTGKGIQQDLQDTISNLFTENTETHQFSKIGSGFGLPISKRYVELLKGNIWFESTVNLGSTFFFNIPLVLVKESIKPLMPMNQKMLSVKKVLIADEDNNSYLLLSLLLKKFNINCLHATNEAEIMTIYQQESGIDLVLIDIKMPQQNTEKLLHQIRKIATEVYIVAQTTCLFDKERNYLLKAGYNDYISKPTNMIDIECMLAQYYKNSNIDS